MNACILYLVDAGDVADFRKSLTHLRQSEALRPYPIIAYHEAGLPKSVMDELSAVYSVRFIEMAFKRPLYAPEVEASIPEVFSMSTSSFTMGYRHMCRFFSGELFKRPELLGYRHALRLDSDSFLLEPVADFFRQLEAAGSVYGYRLISVDHPDCFVDFYRTFRQAVESMGRQYILDPEVERRGFVYYSNFEVLDLDYFRSKLYLGVYDHLDQSGGFYVHRWGDHILRFAFLTQFRAPVKQFLFNYGHADGIYPPEMWHQ